MRKLIMLGAIIAGLALLSVRADTKAVFEKECSKCHGSDGKGDTKMGKKLGAKDYTDLKVQGEMKDENMAKVIREGLKEDGKTKMKPIKDITDAQIKELVAYMRAFAKK